MFLSYKYKGFDNYHDSYDFEITDSEFGTINSSVKHRFSITVTDAIALGIIITTEYGKRNLPIAKNLAIACMFLDGKYHFTNAAKDMDCFYYKHSLISNWKEIAAERDVYIKKYVAMK